MAMALLVVLVAFSMIGDRLETERQLEAARQNLERSGLSWTQDFLDRQQAYSDWFTRHGTSFEARLFDSISRLLVNAASRASLNSDRLSFLTRAYRSLLFAMLRVCFLILASWRLWFLAVMLAAISSFFALRPHRADDLLGQTGNGRLFYSGIRAALDEVDEQGRPLFQVTGLACPAAVSAFAAKSSELGRVLSEYQALNQTNTALTAIILKHSNYPAYVAEREEQSLLDAAFMPAGLADNCLELLKAALSLHQPCHIAAQATADNRGENINPPQDQDTAAKPRKLDSRQYAALLKEAMQRVLTPRLKAELKQIPIQQLATVLLAHEASKVLAYAFEGGRWRRKSAFPQLSARAVLHSIPAFSAEYNLAQRTDIRRALIYGSRRSVFAPVRLPLDLSARSFALRQLVELWLAFPHELPTCADEVELAALVRESHEDFEQVLFKALSTMDHEIMEDFYASTSNLFFMPIAKVLYLLRKVVPATTIRRIETLVALVSQKQRLQAISADLQEESVERTLPGVSDRVLPLLTYQCLKELSALHNINMEDLKDWSALRVILNSYAWLGRRVGDYTVPESSIIFAVLKESEPSAEGNELGLIGKAGMVPFRASRLAARWGKFWYTRFRHVESANMAETIEDFQKLLKGEERRLEEEPEAGSSAAV